MGRPSWERLEPRLLLDADLGGAPSLLGEFVAADYAIHVALDLQDDPIGADLTPVCTLDPGGISTDAGPVAPALPGLQLADSDVANWQGQIIYLDFDGAPGVTYDGPVTVGPFDILAFQAPGEGAGQEAKIVADLVARLQETFADTGVIFTLDRPQDPGTYATIYLGGDDSAFAAYGAFLGLAETVDAGNAIRDDEAFVFSDEILRTLAGTDNFGDELYRAVAHETAHLLGYEHSAGTDSSAGPAVLAEWALAQVEVTGNGVGIANGDTTPTLEDHTQFGTVVLDDTAVYRTFTVYNTGDSTLTLGAVSVPTGFTLTEGLPGSLAPGAWDTFTVQLDTAPLGAKGGEIVFSTNDAGDNPFYFRVAGTVVAAWPPVEEFLGGTDSFDLAHKAILFVPNGSAYSFTIRSITALPTDPAGGTRLTLGDDDAVLVNLDAGRTVVLYEHSAASFYVGSNGCITFGGPDPNYPQALADQFRLPRISALFDDLNPDGTEDAQVGSQQFSDRAVVTWEQVPEWSAEGASTFQITMYYDGRIELAWLEVTATDGIVGLSDGSGLLVGFTETDFSSATPGAPEITVTGNGVTIADADTTPSAADHTDFGTAIQGGAALSRTFTVRNDGADTLTLGTVAVPTGFTLTEGLSASLAPGTSDTFTVRMNLTVVGTNTGDVSFSTNDSDENPFHFRITGTVLPAPEVTVLGNGISIGSGDTSPRIADDTDFGSVVLDGAARYRTFTVRNDGGSTLALGAVSVPEGFTLTEGLAASLAPGETDTFTVQLDTAPLGTKSGDIVFTTSDPDESLFTFRITGQVVLSAAPEMGVVGHGTAIAAGDTTPSPQDGTDFGAVDVGRTVTRTYVIENTGSALLYLTGSPRVTITGSSDFSVLTQPAAVLEPGASTTFQIQFRPTATGAVTATVRIASDDADESLYTFALQGAGVVWDFVFYDDFDDGNFAGWSAVDPQTGAPTTVPEVVVSPEGYALRGVGSGYGQDSALVAMLTRDLPTGYLGELKIAMRAKAGPERPNAAQVQLLADGDFYTVVDYALDSWDLQDRATWQSWVDGAGELRAYPVEDAPGEWHDFAWTRDAQGYWSLFIDGQLQVGQFQLDNQLQSFTDVAISLLRDQSEIEWITIAGNLLPDSAFAVPVYRFWSPVISDHFYTTSATERNKLITQYAGVWIDEGIAYYAFPDDARTGTVPVYRFWSPQDSIHLFTMDQAERDRLIATYPQEVWTYEGIAFYVYPTDAHPTAASPVYRFWSPPHHAYLFTMSVVERDYLLATYPSDIWTYQDEAWYAFDLG